MYAICIIPSIHVFRIHTVFSKPFFVGLSPSPFSVVSWYGCWVSDLLFPQIFLVLLYTLRTFSRSWFWVPFALLRRANAAVIRRAKARRTRALVCTVYPKKYAHGFCFAVLCCGYTLTDFPISIRLTSLALWQSNDCPSASKATLMNMDKYMWIHYERLHNHNKAKHNKTVCIYLGIYCTTADYASQQRRWSIPISSHTW